MGQPGHSRDARPHHPAPRGPHHRPERREVRAAWPRSSTTPATAPARAASAASSARRTSRRSASSAPAASTIADPKALMEARMWANELRVRRTRTTSPQHVRRASHRSPATPGNAALDDRTARRQPSRARRAASAASRSCRGRDSHGQGQRVRVRRLLLVRRRRTARRTAHVTAGDASTRPTRCSAAGINAYRA